MIFENNAELRGLLRRGVSGDAVHELLNAKSFVLADVDFAAAVAEVKAQHASHSDAEAEARAAYRLLTCNPAQPPIARMSRWQELKRWAGHTARAAWPWLKIAWAVAVLVLLMAVVARGQERSEDLAPRFNSSVAARSRRVLAHLYPEPDVPGSVIIQLQNQGTVLATRPAGIVRFNCTTNMTCSFSGTTFTLTSSGGGGTAHNLLSATHSDTTPATVVRGDLISGQTASPVWQRLALGSNNQVLESNGTDAQWLTLGKPQLPGTAVYTDQANTYSAGDQNMAAAASYELPVSAGAAPTTNGGVAFDSTQNRLVGGGAAVRGGIPRMLLTCYSNTASATNGCSANDVSGTTAANATADCISAVALAGCVNAGTTETAFATGFTIPANYLIKNKVLQACITFDYVATATVPTFTPRIRLGGAAGTLVYTGTANPSAAGTVSGLGACWILQGTGAAGASVNVEMDPQGSFSLAGTFSSRNTTTQPVLVATNASKQFTFTMQFSAATTGNNVTLRQMTVMEMN